MDKVGGAVLGPRPGKAICSFWQGRVEITMRIIAPLFGALPALIAAAVALGEAQTFGGFQNVSASAGLVVAISSIAIIIETSMVVIRILNIGLINIYIKIVFTIVVLITIVVLVGGFIAGGVTTAIYGNDYYRGDIPNPGSGAPPDVRGIGEALISTSFFCFLSLILFGMLIMWDILFLLKQWNDKVVEYTLKAAVIG